MEVTYRFSNYNKKCPELDLGKCSDNYDPSMVPKSMFTTDGQPLPLRDQAKIHPENELLPPYEHQVVSVMWIIIQRRSFFLIE